MSSAVEELIVCGWDKVFIYNMRNIVDGLPEIVWTWDAKDSDQVPDHMKATFASTDECKPIEDTENILITSSSGGVAIVDRQTGVVSFYARVVNAHSAEMLPKGRLVVASSLGEDGNKLIVFDVDKSDSPISSVAMPSAHGVVWDEKRGYLWALSFDELRCYSLCDWDSTSPTLQCAQVYKLPYDDGHDLVSVPNSDDLLITAADNVMRFDKDTQVFTDYKPLSGKPHVKGVAIHPETAQIAYVQAEGENWWAERIHLISSDHVIHIPGEHFYKIRWNQC